MLKRANTALRMAISENRHITLTNFGEDNNHGQSDGAQDKKPCFDTRIQRDHGCADEEPYKKQQKQAVTNNRQRPG